VLGVTAVVKADVPEFAEKDGAEDKRPKPKAETATSAMRLRVVFVDIDFLSLVVKKTFLFTAGKGRPLAS